MIHEKYIEVAVALPVEKTYTYQIPDHFKENCFPGMRVLIPFGRRRVTGYILSGQAECKGFKVKNILDLLDDFPLFPESMIPLFRWISDYYLYPLGDVIKAALPVGLNSYDISMAALTDQGMMAAPEAQKDLSAGESEVIHLLASSGPCSIKQMANKIGNHSIHALIRKLEKNDLITVTAQLKKDQARIKTETMVSFEKWPDQSLRMSKKRHVLLNIVKEKGQVSLSKLKNDIPTAARLIKPLEAAGCLKTTQRQVFRDPLGDPVDPDTPPELTGEQEQAVETVVKKLDQGFHTYLISGVTGSGKTEVYMRMVASVIEQGRQAIVLVPEISLISQTERRFRARFGNKIAVIHSALTKGELLDQWHLILKNKVDVVIGPRSSIFAPVHKLGIVIVDEEHDGSYKQETGLRYNARDVAILRARQSGVPVILGSATPSVQSYFRVVENRFTEIKLTRRINQHPLPEIHCVDLKQFKEHPGTQKIITPVLSRAIRDCLDKGQQALIFLNRRGFATLPICGECGKTLKCRFCDVSMTFHRTWDQYRCHLCGFTAQKSTACPECHSTKIKPLGFGTEKIEAMLKKMFPDARLARMDQDTTSKKGEILNILKSIRNRTVDIVVGTQMLAKGHDFPSITLVGIICADLSLSLPDFRASERTFQVLAQVAGRAGRGDTPGRVIMQTFSPDHFSIEASKNQDFQEFFQQEAPFRKALMYPPFSRMVLLKMSGSQVEHVKTYAQNVAAVFQKLMDQNDSYTVHVQVLGPIEAAIPKIASRFRWQIILKSTHALLMNQMIKQMRHHENHRPLAGVKLAIDVDPYSLM